MLILAGGSLRPDDRAKEPRTELQGGVLSLLTLKSTLYPKSTPSTLGIRTSQSKPARNNGASAPASTGPRAICGMFGPVSLMHRNFAKGFLFTWVSHNDLSHVIPPALCWSYFGAHLRALDQESKCQLCAGPVLPLRSAPAPLTLYEAAFKQA